MKLHILPVLAFISIGLASPAFAASSDWFDTEGGEIRLVTEDKADESGILRGVLEIVLRPGWKTYWMDPGDAGVPPQVDISASRDVSSAVIRFPAPRRFDDGYAVWAGYKDHVLLAIEFEVGDFPLLEADVFLGVCEKICIPVQTRFSIDPYAVSADGAEAKTVEDAFAGLPKAADETFRLHALELTTGETLRARTTNPAIDGNKELFIASAEGWYFGTPKLSEDGQVFDVPILGRPKNTGDDVKFNYTLISGADAVSGTTTISTAKSN